MWRDWTCLGTCVSDSPKEAARSVAQDALFRCPDNVELAPHGGRAATAEATLEEMLSDCIVTALMRADGVDRQELEAMLGWVSQRRRLIRDHEELAAN